MSLLPDRPPLSDKFSRSEVAFFNARLAVGLISANTRASSLWLSRTVPLAHEEPPIDCFLSRPVDAILAFELGLVVDEGRLFGPLNEPITLEAFRHKSRLKPRVPAVSSLPLLFPRLLKALTNFHLF